MYDHVLVGTDGSATATRAVAAAARLAHGYQAKLTIVHAFRNRRYVPAPDAPFIPRELTWQLTSGGAAESVVSAAASEAQLVACGGLHIETRVEPGSPTHVLLALSRELTPDAVVVGNADVHRARIGRSVGQVLARRAAAQVVIVDTIGRGRAA